MVASFTIIKLSTEGVDSTTESLSCVNCRWAIVEDASVAAKMAYFIQLNTLGLSQDAQARGITLLRAIMSSYENQRAGGVERERQPFFHYGQAVLEGRWRRMRQALDNTSRFDLPEYESSFCSFLGKNFRANPGKYLPRLSSTKLLILNFSSIVATWIN